MHEACSEVARRSTTVYKVGVAPIEHQVHEACIEVARRSTTVYKVGAAYRARHRLSDTYYSRTPLQQKLKDFRIIQWQHRVGQHERYLHTNFEGDRTNRVGTMTN